MKNQYRVGDYLKRGLGQFADLRGDLARIRGVWGGGGGVDNPMQTIGLNIEDSVWSVIMVTNDSVIIYIYLAFRSCYCFGLV